MPSAHHGIGEPCQHDDEECLQKFRHSQALGIIKKHRDEDVITDLSSEDAELEFWNNNKDWNDSEILRTDQGFDLLHKLTGNTRLLRDSVAGRDSLRFYRYEGKRSGCGTVACNYGSNHHIYVGDETFSGSQDWTRQVFVHEIAHNWEDEGSVWSSFLAESGWSKSGGAGRTRGSYVDSDGVTQESDWYFSDSTQDFARAYGRYNPYEDFATTFALYVTSENGVGFVGTPQGGFVGLQNGNGTMPDKMQLIDAWINYITT